VLGGFEDIRSLTVYICLCNGITEKQIRDAVLGGLNTLPAVRHGLGVASSCGRCADFAQQVIFETLAPTADADRRQAA